MTRTAIVFSCAVFCLPAAVLGEVRPSAAQLEFFETKVRPLLATHCFACHSAKSKELKAGLRLDSRAGMIKGGDSGAAIVPGKSAESHLVKAVRFETVEMPPDGKLADKEIAALVKWVEMGAPWPADKPQAPSEQASTTYDWDKLRRAHWAWQPVRNPSLPKVKNDAWPTSEIDFFVLAKLEAAGLKPAPPAAPRTLVRRMYFDLIGLPPSPEEMQQWADRLSGAQQAARGARLNEQALAELVDYLLESPHYGERWGRHWLDVARYSDGFGGFLDNAALPHAWRYRDWVVESLNRDMPYDRFVKLQIAGDLTAGPGGTVATGFFALGPTYKSDGGDPDSVAQAKSETLDDRIDTLARGMLGMTIACARCHDHKFDPIPQQDYYSLAGVFNNTKAQERPCAPAEEIRMFNDHQKTIGQLDQKIKQQQNQIKKENRAATDDEKRQLDQWNGELQELRKKSPPKYAVAHSLTDSGSGDMKVALRGNLRQPGEVAPRRFPRILAGEEPPRFTKGSGRLELAEAVARSDNPLTARVFVNRVWMHHFGKAIVRSPSNFGSLGQKPTHPLLLDWLAHQFIHSGWSIKQLHRTIMSSAAYQMSSRFNATGFRGDGDNELVWRMNPRRLDVEAWRDSLLAVSGELDRNLGGPPVENVDNRRRTLYFKVSRNGDRFATDQFLRLFDFPLMRATVAKRPQSIVPQQYLFMMNSPFMAARAKALASRLQQEAKHDAARIKRAYQLLYGRPPTAEEEQIGLEFLAQSGGEKHSPWQRYSQVLLSANELMYIR